MDAVSHYLYWHAVRDISCVVHDAWWDGAILHRLVKAIFDWLDNIRIQGDCIRNLEKRGVDIDMLVGVAILIAIFLGL